MFVSFIMFWFRFLKYYYFITETNFVCLLIILKLYLLFFSFYCFVLFKLCVLDCLLSTQDPSLFLCWGVVKHSFDCL